MNKKFLAISMFALLFISFVYSVSAVKVEPANKYTKGLSKKISSYSCEQYFKRHSNALQYAKSYEDVFDYKIKKGKCVIYWK